MYYAGDSHHPHKHFYVNKPIQLIYLQPVELTLTDLEADLLAAVVFGGACAVIAKSGDDDSSLALINVCEVFHLVINTFLKG